MIQGNDDQTQLTAIGIRRLYMSLPYNPEKSNALSESIFWKRRRLHRDK